MAIGDIKNKRLKIDTSQLVTTGTPSSSSFLAGDGSYQEITIDSFDVVGGRLDWVSATSIKWGFQNSNQIRLVNPDTGRWELVKVATEPTLANNATDLNGTALAVDKIYDVFAEYSSGTAVTLVASRWQATGTGGNSARTAAWAGNTAYNIGDRVSTGSPTHYYVCITAHTSDATTFSNDSAKWVDNGVAADVGSSDFYGLYRHDGVLVSDSSTTGKSRRWLGIIYTYNNSGTVNFKDDTSYRYIANYYNRQTKTVTCTNATSSWSYAVAVWREGNNGVGQSRASFVTLSPISISTNIKLQLYSAGVQASIGIGLDSTSSPMVISTGLFPGVANALVPVNSPYSGSVSHGFHYVTGLEKSDSAATIYFYSAEYSIPVLLQN